MAQRSLEFYVFSVENGIKPWLYYFKRSLAMFSLKPCHTFMLTLDTRSL